MKRMLLCVMLLTLVLTASADQEPRQVIIPGKARIDVEQLNQKLPIDINIDELSIAETRVLRNAVSARQGYCFLQGDLRALFDATTWYDSIMEARYWQEEEGKAKPISYSPIEQQFVKRLKEHEDRLRALNNTAPEGMLVNTDNIINPFQLETFDERLRQTLAKQGFAIVPGKDLQLFHVYERNDYHQFPSFVTTDLFLQAFHIYFDCLLKETEEQKLMPLVASFVKQNHALMYKTATTATSAKVKAAAERCVTYYAIAYALCTGKQTLGVPSVYTAQAVQEIKNVNDAESRYSEFLGYTPGRDMPQFAYGIYRPRGHYTRNDTLQRYFRAMMWLQNVPFATDNEEQLTAALLMAHTIGSNPKLTAAYRQLDELITYLMGLPDDVSILQVYDILRRQNAPLPRLLNGKKQLQAVRQAIEVLSERQTRIKPKYQLSSKYKICLMPQRCMPDGEVLQEMVDYDSQPTRRPVPKGLDVLAAIGIPAAERLLVDELKEPARWNKYTATLERMKQRMDEVNWQQTVANRWIASLKDVVSKDSQWPAFMLSPQWEKKNLNTALASWAELKHDAILYAKQPFGAECGGAGPPAPVCRGYVEPNTAYWSRAIEVIDATMQVLKRFNLVTEKAQTASTDLREKAEFLLQCSRKELRGQRLSDEEYNQIEFIGSAFENITLNLIKEPDQWLMGWDDVSGADKSIAVVADVYTANAGNNPAKSVLYEAVGPAHEIYVVVEIEGYLYLTRGAVLSYREFQEDGAAPRLTDEEWQQQLEVQPNKGIPQWLLPFIVPLDGKQLDNEYIFYSSGC